MPYALTLCPKFGHFSVKLKPYFCTRNFFYKDCELSFCFRKVILCFHSMSTAATNSVTSASFYYSELRAGCQNLGQGTLVIMATVFCAWKPLKFRVKSRTCKCKRGSQKPIEKHLHKEVKSDKKKI